MGREGRASVESALRYIVQVKGEGEGEYQSERVDLELTFRKIGRGRVQRARG